MLSVLWSVLIMVVAMAGPSIDGTQSAFSAVTADASNTFASAATFCTATSATALWVTGFEHGAMSTAGFGVADDISTGTGSSIAANATGKRNGAYGIRVTKANNSQAWYYKSFTPTGVVTLRMAFKLDALPGADVVALASVLPASGKELWIAYDAGLQRYAMRWSTNGAAGPEVGGAAVTAGSWQYLELKVDMASNPRRVDWRVNGAAQPAATYSETGSTVTGISLGSWQIPSGPFTLNADDILVLSGGAAYPPGDGRVSALRPSANDTHTNPGHFTNNGGSAIDSASWSRLDDAPFGSDMEWVTQVTGNAASMLNFQIEDTAEPCINAVWGLSGHTSPGTWNGSTAVVVGGTTRVFHNANFTGDQIHGGLIAPATSWSTAAVNGMTFRVGGSTSPDKPIWHSLMVEVDAAV
jgi:hypothetical protein